MSGWESAHIYDHGDQDALITQMLEPLLAELSPYTDGSFFIRYWKGGPHVRLRVRPREGVDAGTVRRTVLVNARRYFAARPPVERFDVAEFAVRQQIFAMLEGENGSARFEMVDDGSVLFETYHPETGKYGGNRGVAIAERLFARSSGLAAKVLRWAGRDSVRRQQAGMSMMSSAVHAAGLSAADITRFLASYRDFWAAYVPVRVRRKWRERAAAEPPPQAVPQPECQEWADAVAAAVAEVRADPRGVLAQVRREPEAFEDSLGFLLCHYLHTHNNRLGIPPWEESYLAFLSLERGA